MKAYVCTSAEVKPDFVSRQIMRFLKTPYSHIYLVVDGIMYHAVDRGVCAEPYEYFLKDHVEVGRKEVELKCDLQGWKAWFNEFAGVEYSNTQYGGFMAGFLKKWTANKRTKAVCSEFVAWALHDHCDYIHFNDDVADFLDPKTVFEAIP